MQLDQIVSVVIRFFASFYLIKHVAQLALSTPLFFGLMGSDAGSGAPSLWVWSPFAVIVAEIAAFAKSRALAQWLLKGA